MEDKNMTDIQDTIMRDIEADPTIDSKKLTLEIKASGFLKKRKIIRLIGNVKSETEKEKAMQIVLHFAGDSYDVENNLIVNS
jgi:hypothetical protein